MANEKRLIDADLYEEFLIQYAEDLTEIDAHMIAGAIGRCISKLEWQPTVDAVEVVHGRWIDVALRFTQVKEKCSVCGGIVYAHGFNYCPNCGANMRGDNE